MSKKNNQRKNIVYSTNPDYDYDYNETQEKATLNNSEQKLYVSLDRKNRGGKEVTIIDGFVGLESDLKDLGKFLKTKCGVGGTVKNNIINIQGNHRDKVMNLLLEMGYTVKRKGG